MLHHRYETLKYFQCQYIAVVGALVQKWVLSTPPHHRVAKMCGPCGPVGAIFFWPVLIFGKSSEKQAKTGEKQALFGANFFGGKIGRC